MFIVFVAMTKAYPVRQTLSMFGRGRIGLTTGGEDSKLPGAIMPKRTDIHSVLIIGAGPIIIGQACEFDYSGTQACKALREEGYRIILVNSNPATIMTDPEFADRTYIEPITPECVEKIIERETEELRRVGATGRLVLLPTLGGQTALNTAMALVKRGTLERYGVEMIGAKAAAIERGEDRRIFKELMLSIGLDVPISGTANTLEESRAVAEKIGRYPLIIRPAFTLGGTGGGIAYNREEFEVMAKRGMELSPVSEILIEESLLGWKEFEMEVMRDKADNCVIICSIENFDPMGVHTGDSITVAPIQTLTDKEYQIMRDASFAVIRAVGVETGGSNIQFAVQSRDGTDGDHRDEPAGVAVVGAGVESDGISHCENRGQAGSGVFAGRDPERHHARDAGELRADNGLRGHESAAVYV